MNNSNIYINNKKHLNVALVGNPNSGKTTLFNALTGSNQRVGNWPGVTVERKTGICTLDPSVTIVDTPGCYSLTPFTPEEQVTASYLTEGKPDVILNVTDSTCLERSLLLTVQLLALGIPTVVALNMQDEAQAKGISVSEKELSEFFKCPFVSISAMKNRGIAELVEQCRKTATSPNTQKASKKPTADDCYAQIETALQRAVSVSPQKDKQALTEKIDRVLLNRWLAFPILILLLSAVFFVSVGGLGGWLTDLIESKVTPWMQRSASKLLASAPKLLNSLVCDGVIGGVMSVVGFVPQITLLFGCIALLEACGYMARIAFITDRALCGLGLGGRSFVCMLLGCGCSVPAIMSTRTIKNAEERQTTVTLAPFVPCSAKLAVIAYFTSYVFDGNTLFAVSFYLTSVVAVIVGGLALKLLKRKPDFDNVFLLELPPYRLPKARNVLYQMWDRAKAFLVKAGTIIFAASVLLWVMTNFGFDFRQAETEASMLAALGKFIAPLFTPLGFNDRGCGWQLAVATVSGLAAKETVITTLQILLPDGIANAVSPLGAYSFVMYNLLTVPCIAAISASFAEQGNWKNGLKTIIFQIATAYLMSLTVYQTGNLALKHPSAFAAVLTILLLATALFAAVRHAVRRRASPCRGCYACDKTTRHC